MDFSGTPSNTNTPTLPEPIHQTTFEFDTNNGIPVAEDAKLTDNLSPTQQHLIWHYRLGHLPFATLTTAKNGDLPQRLGCRFGKATKINLGGIKGEHIKFDGLAVAMLMCWCCRGCQRNPWVKW